MESIKLRRNNIDKHSKEFLQNTLRLRLIKQIVQEIFRLREKLNEFILNWVELYLVGMDIKRSLNPVYAATLTNVQF